MYHVQAKFGKKWETIETFSDELAAQEWKRLSSVSGIYENLELSVEVKN